MEAIPAVPAGENPYTYYLETLDSTLYRTPSAGFKWRLIVLFGLASIAMITSVLYILILWEDARRKKNESMWLFRFVQRPAGRYIVTNSKLASAVLSIICLVFVLGALQDCWTVYLHHGSQIRSGGWRTLTSLPFGVHGWLLAWGQLQAFLLTPDHITAIIFPPLVANILFLGLGGFLALGLLISSIFMTIASVNIWKQFEAVQGALTTLQASWTGTLDINGLINVQQLLTDVTTRENQLKNASRWTTPFACSITLLVLVVNVGSVALTRVVRKQIKLKFDNFASSRVVGDFEWNETFVASHGGSSSFRRESDTTRRDSHNNGSNWGGSTMYHGSNQSNSQVPRRESRNSVSRSNIRKMSVAGLGAQSEHARQLATLQKAERDLVIISAMVGVVAAICTGFVLWVTIALGNGTTQTLPWDLYEFSILGFYWVYTSALAFTYPFLIHNSWVNLPSKGEDTNSSRRGSRTSLGQQAGAETYSINLAPRYSLDSKSPISSTTGGGSSNRDSTAKTISSHRGSAPNLDYVWQAPASRPLPPLPRLGRMVSYRDMDSQQVAQAQIGQLQQPYPLDQHRSTFYIDWQTHPVSRELYSGLTPPVERNVDPLDEAGQNLKE
ncbi:hypothetical protein T439DRAFT_160529 [Meredithblackwellia eburnea MCA 4105]